VEEERKVEEREIERRTPVRKVVRRSRDEKEEEEEEDSDEGRKFYQKIKEEDLEFLLANAESSSWITRFNSFEKISELISEINKEGE